MASKYVVLDLFAGAGGLTEGFLQNDFNVIAHVEMEPYAAKTIETRSLYHFLKMNNKEEIYFKYYNGEITREDFIHECSLQKINDTGLINQEIRSDNDDEIIRIIQNRLEQQNIKKVDVIIGGPPCQAYSLVGRGRDPFSMKHDPRNLLYLHYLKFLKIFSPDIFVFENVLGITSAKEGTIYNDFIRLIKEHGYTISQKIPILCSSDFGVLQDRKRIVIIGWKNQYQLEYPNFQPIVNNYRIWNLLKDLPELSPGMGKDGPQKYKKIKKSKYLSEFGIRNDETYVRHHIARPHNERDRNIYRIAINKWNLERKRLKYSELPNKLITHSNQISFLDRFKVVDGEGLSHAIVAHISKDGHYFIHPDINQARSITVREAARIQSFPDNYLFEGPRTSQFEQIGNAVPPLMAKGIAKEIKNMLEKI